MMLPLRLACLCSLLATFLTIIACGGTKNSGLLVFAASSLTEVFQDIGNAYHENHRAIPVRFHFAGSSTLRSQVDHGAQADIFATANALQMDLAQSAGRILGTSQAFATNRMAVVATHQNTTVSDIRDLANPGIRLALAMPQVPAGSYARETLQRLATNPDFGVSFLPRVLANAVSAEFNVRQVIGKVLLGEVDAGFVYESDITISVKPALRSIPIPETYNVIASYYIGIIQGTKRLEEAKEFIGFLLSEEGQAILQKHGFGLTQK